MNRGLKLQLRPRHWTVLAVAAMVSAVVAVALGLATGGRATAAPPTTLPPAPPTTVSIAVARAPAATIAPPGTVVVGTVPSDAEVVEEEVPARAPGEPVVSGPTVSLDRYEFQPGESAIVTAVGFRSRAVTITVCGNEARRGSADCNMPGSKALEIDRDSVTSQAYFLIAVPPTPCPCLIRVSNSDQSEVGIAAFTLGGHPVAEPVSPDDPGPLVDVTLDAEPNYGGLVGRARASLGGSIEYYVTVRITNLTTTKLTGLKATASAGRDETDDLADVPIANPGELQAGQTWEQTVAVELPAPRWGSVSWSALVSGSGPAVSTSASTSDTPIALIVLIAVLVADVLVLALQRIRKRRRRRADKRTHVRPSAPKQGDVVDVPWDDGPSVGHPIPAQEPELVG